MKQPHRHTYARPPPPQCELLSGEHKDALTLADMDELYEEAQGAMHTDAHALPNDTFLLYTE